MDSRSSSVKGMLDGQRTVVLVLGTLSGIMGCAFFLLTGYGHWFVLALVTTATFAWHFGFRIGLLMSLLPPMASAALMALRGVDPVFVARDNLVYLFISILVGSGIGYLSSLNRRLNEAYNEITALRGFLPICASCKNVRDDAGYWHQIEDYVSRHSEAEFSHGLCPGCVAEFLAETGIDGEPLEPRRLAGSAVADDWPKMN